VDIRRCPLGGGQLRAWIQRAVGDQREQHALDVGREAPGAEHAGQRPINAERPPQPVQQPHATQRPRRGDLQLARHARQRRAAAVTIDEARDRRRQPAQPGQIELVLAAEVDQHLCPRDPRDAPVVRQLHVAHQRPVRAPPLRCPQVHAHTTSTQTAQPQAKQPQSVCPRFRQSAKQDSALQSQTRA